MRTPVPTLLILLLCWAATGCDRSDAYCLAVEVAARHPNLYVDTASSMIDNGMIEYAVDHLGPEKILFGTDMPALDPWVQRAKVEGAEITEEAKRLIMGGNVERLLGL